MDNCADQWTRISVSWGTHSLVINVKLTLEHFCHERLELKERDRKTHKGKGIKSSGALVERVKEMEFV